jgi:uncharacterized RDD family membrane protein YckC
MTHSPSDPSPPQLADGQSPLYATFPRRLNAMTLDLVIILVIFAILAMVSVQYQQSPTAHHLLAVAWWGILLFYDPVLVASSGGTVGHRALNLRVVDTKTGGNVGFAKACGRSWLKTILGVFSFFGMAFTRRHQAFHDVLTGTSVQMRDPAKAKPYHYVHEGEPLIRRSPPN